MESKLLLDDGEITRTLERLAYQILEKHEKCENIMLVGIERRGADLARRLQKILSSTVNHEVALGTLTSTCIVMTGLPWTPLRAWVSPTSPRT